MIGHWLTAWTIRLALSCYTAVLVGIIVGRSDQRTREILRLLWTLGAALFVAHVLCAFGFYHAWSHAKALQHTADETLRLIGWRFGLGIHFNYAFAMIWIGDSIGSWHANDESPATSGFPSTGRVCF